MMLGDFNTLTTAQENDRGMPMTNYKTSDLQVMAQACNLVDIRAIGCRWTWTNGEVSRKLDRAMVNTQWLLEDFQSYAEFLASGCLSDHLCCVVSLLDVELSQWRPFKFHNMWALHESFHALIDESWGETVVGTAQFRLKQKLSRLKQPLWALNLLHFQHISKKAKRASANVEAVQ